MARSLRANGVWERTNKAILQEVSQVSSGRSCMSIWKGAWQDPDERLMYYNKRGTHRGETCCDRASLDTMDDGETNLEAKFVG